MCSAVDMLLGGGKWWGTLELACKVGEGAELLACMDDPPSVHGDDIHLDGYIRSLPIVHTALVDCPALADMTVHPVSRVDVESFM